MSQSFPFVSRIPGGANKSSSCCSGLVEAPSAISAPASPKPVTEIADVKANGHVQPEPEQKKKVVVVGAGMAGLRAAAVLYRHGVDVVLLEGRNRIGGRIWTIRQEENKSVIRDMGAAWMHETSQNQLVKLIRKLGMTYYYDDGTPLYYTKYGRTGSQFKAKKVAEEFADYIEWYYETNPKAKDRSVDEFIKSFVDQHELISEDERLWAPQAVRDIEHMLGTSTTEASAKHLSYFATERNLYMRDGYDPIVEWTAESLKKADVIQLNQIVQHIKWSENGPASVGCQSADTGEVSTVVGDAVIVTAPLGTYHHDLISFSPPLPDDIQLGISKFGYGALGKVFFEFSEIFWSKDNDQFIFYPSPEGAESDQEDGEQSSPSSTSSDSTGEDDNILNYPTTTVNLSLVADGSKELCVQIVEPLTQRIEAMSGDRKKIYDFFVPLFKLIRTELYKTLPRLVNVVVTTWTQDPLAGFGTFSTEKVGDDPHLLLQAVENHKASKLQVAGEHCAAAGGGCVHGAFFSGESAARNLLATFGVPYDGGDLVSLKPEVDDLEAVNGHVSG